MRISLIAVGTKMPAWVSLGVAEYGKRMPRELKLDWREIPLARRGKDANAQQLCRSQGIRLFHNDLGGITHPVHSQWACNMQSQIAECRVEA